MLAKTAGRQKAVYRGGGTLRTTGEGCDYMTGTLTRLGMGKKQMPTLWEAIRTRGRVAKAVLRDWTILGQCLLGLIVLFALPCLWLPAGSDRVQWQGMLFQATGIIIVAWGLADTRRRLFNKAPLLKELWDRLRRLSHIIKPRTQIIGALAAVEAGNSLQAHAIIRKNVAGSVEERLTALTENLRHIDEELSQLHQHVLRLEKEIITRIESERRERQSEERSIRELIENATVGGIHLEYSGMVFLLIGTLFTSVPNFVASVLGKVGF
jgi:hypothetical protein